MATAVSGIVKAGVVVPDSPLPEGTRVQILLPDVPTEIPPELQAEFEAWSVASAQALELVERLAQEGPADEQR
jgi:hypothetical protein